MNTKNKLMTLLVPAGITFATIIGMAARKLFYYTDMTNSRYFIENWYIYVPCIAVAVGIRMYVEFKD